MPLGFFSALTLADTAIVLTLMTVFLRRSGERARHVFFGERPIVKEIGVGLMTVPLVLFGISTIVGWLRLAVPSLHNVPVNPFEAFFHDKTQAAIFLVLAIVVGGVREELERGFLLHRFGQRLGGEWLGLVLFSLLFGAGHYTQGYDVAIGTGALGFFWGLLYIRRRSVAAAMTSHAGFNALQVILQTTIRAGLR